MAPVHPHEPAPNAIGISSSEGALLFDEHSNSYIDAVSSIYMAMRKSLLLRQRLMRHQNRDQNGVTVFTTKGKAAKPLWR